MISRSPSAGTAPKQIAPAKTPSARTLKPKLKGMDIRFPAQSIVFALLAAMAVLLLLTYAKPALSIYVKRLRRLPAFKPIDIFVSRNFVRKSNCELCKTTNASDQKIVSGGEYDDLGRTSSDDDVSGNHVHSTAEPNLTFIQFADIHSDSFI